MSDVLEAPYTRLLVDRFAETFRFYRNVLPELTGAKLAGGNEASGYASWDLDGRTVFALFGRGHMAAALGTAQLPPGAGAQDHFSVVVHLADHAALDRAVTRCTEAGAELVAPAQDRPQWGPTLRTAHLRDPDGHLIELQTY
ncbi:VOC family protein [Streptomyces sp. NBC_01465]|uniref:VOC family protein n=1 Tax=Streptomyces sp. NBC_01465 TaxID=2903878 RepID=UPI002E30A0B2|nr:VOC family protein [Streptomyces sp. NBC_01465]